MQTNILCFMFTFIFFLYLQEVYVIHTLNAYTPSIGHLYADGSSFYDFWTFENTYIEKQRKRLWIGRAIIVDWRVPEYALIKSDTQISDLKSSRDFTLASVMYLCRVYRRHGNKGFSRTLSFITSSYHRFDSP